MALPLMPGGADMASPMMPPSVMPPMGGPPSGDLMSLLGGQAGGPSSDPSALSSTVANIMNQLDQMGSMAADLARLMPGSEDVARQVIEGIERWKQMAVVGGSPTAPGMPGASQMM